MNVEDLYDLAQQLAPASSVEVRTDRQRHVVILSEGSSVWFVSMSRDNTLADAREAISDVLQTPNQ